MKKVPFVISTLVPLCVLAFAGAAHATTYEITDLTTLGGTASHAYGVNIHGDVVGESLTTTGLTHAFLYHNGAMTDLGVLDNTNNFSQAFGINDAGVVVGKSTQNASDNGSRPFVYNGSMSFVGSLGGNYGWANDINNAGQIVGISAKSNGVTHAFRKTNSSMLDLGSLGASNDYSIAYGINDLGSVAGYSVVAPNFSDAFLYSGGGPMQDLGNLGGFSRGFAVNNADHVTGASIIDGDGHERAFLWHNGTLSDIGTTGGAVTSQGLDINNFDQVVGTLVFNLNNGELNHGFLYSNGIMVDVNTLLPQNSGWVLRDAQAINDVGQIVGFGNINGQQHAYLLTPVPEPSTLFLLGIGAITLLGYRKLKSDGK